MKFSRTLSVLAFTASLTMSTAEAAPAATDVDRIFVSKVSQGGLYEVKASELAEHRASNPNVKFLAKTEVRDHKQVNDKLLAIAMDTKARIDPKLNGEFQARLDTLKSASAADFDAAYVADMKAIHDKDEKLFAQEAQDGSSAYQGFASETDAIVKGHIQALINLPGF